MIKKILFITIFMGSVSIALSAQADSDSSPCIACEQLKELSLPDLTILEAKETAEGHCRVLGRISKEINFELLLPKIGTILSLWVVVVDLWEQLQINSVIGVDAGFATVGTDAVMKAQYVLQVGP